GLGRTRLRAAQHWPKHDARGVPGVSHPRERGPGSLAGALLGSLREGAPRYWGRSRSLSVPALAGAIRTDSRGPPELADVDALAIHGWRRRTRASRHRRGRAVRPG